jgi:thiazole synthase
MANWFRARPIRSAGWKQMTGSTLFIPWREAEMWNRESEDQLTLYGKRFVSRLLLGTALRIPTTSSRCDFSGRSSFDNRFLAATASAGCHTVRDAVTTACMARELFETSLIKLEVIGDEVNLQPDPFRLLEAATELVKRGFKVLPYCTEDWVLCSRLLDAGCEVLMPWAAPIGTGQGPRNPSALRELRLRLPHVPLIVDAGIGLPSHACQVMEWGFDAVLVNSAVSHSIDPVRMATAFSAAVTAGRSGYLAGPMAVQPWAVPSTPEIGRPFSSLESGVVRSDQTTTPTLN